MAARGAHITPNIELKASLFEVLAADSLHVTFYPAIKRVVDFLSTAKPTVFGGFVRYYDEFYLLFDSFVQGYYLKRYSGSLAEVFYGLTRISLRSKTFSTKDRNWSFVVLVLIPYAIRKLEKECARWKDDYENAKHVSTFRRWMFRFQPYLKACYESLKLINYVCYLANVTQNHSPSLGILRLGLTYLSEEEESWSFKDMLKGKVRIATVMSAAILRWLELSAFFLQFIEWWQTEANIGDLSKLPIPDAPELDANALKYANVCPICLQKPIIPTAVSVSGYVYCYRCITTQLQSEGRCPVTKYPATINDLIGIFTGDDE
ncbi:peroxisome assembly protein 12-A [Anopheles nili]|uniref:peroxisome assembly protein 12-A n=1 Tax=Anopheles nili TaxID=185578 RepID=UPI00237B9993|nr:peroxisome assembly protein 12-A [Anopheles nili]